MASKMNWKSQILNDLFDLKEIRNFESNTDNKGENNKKDVLTTAKPKETVSISKNTVPRNQRWKTSLINKIKEDILNNDSGKFENILKKVNNDKKLQEEKTKISKKEVIQINDSTKEKAKKSVNIGDTIQTKPKSVVIEIDDNQTKKLKDTKINDDSIIIVDNPTKKRKRQSKTKKKGENIDKEKEKDNKNTSKKQKKLKNIDIKEKEKSKPKPIVPKKKYPVLSKSNY
ncbi:hypothetical protein BCR36DRAFT_369759 [Piromyces finnis]|uniref:Uncharacterized protein n=1 Tax=Piromyces finnis TaxID=1754191 RepID=A0A1Y1VBB8_9FUNG|nr:hypothetical protein BCR36DRAFT_369759 [Piromyces finnis]|eukprot:ORX51851.1 hypothetical protein BCR36DRAFT_369759 [Piromyces finnis]